MARAMTIVLPPSEGKAPGGTRDHHVGVFDEELEEGRRRVAKALGAAAQGISPAEGKRLFGATGFLLERAIECAQEVAAGTALVLPAWQRYTGVVWSHLQPASLAPIQREAIVVPSGLYGLSVGTDLIADFRLTMGASLSGVGKLSSFWRRSLTDVLEDYVGEGVVYDLLTSEQRAALDYRRLSQLDGYVPVEFVRRDGHGAAGHAAKAIKGIVARTLLDAGVDGVARLKWQGWRTSIRGRVITVIAP